MKAQLGWLREHVDLPEPASEVGRRLTSLGFALDGLAGEGDAAVLELDVGSNRPDALSHVGLARELATATARALRLPQARLSESATRAESVASVVVEAPDLCPRYCARVVQGVTVRPSPAWMAERLEACGIRPINVIVDVTNYVLLELGHPLHAFDLSLLPGGGIVVRRARAGERMTTLDGAERELVADDLLIADSSHGVALAGVMGGANTEIRDTTRDVLLESAWFLPSAVRRTSKRTGLHTEASHRFERGADVEMAPVALDRAAQLLAELAGGTVLAGRIDVRAPSQPPRQVPLRRERLDALTGATIPDATVERVLPSLGFALSARDSAGWIATVPSWRLDVSREVDLVEEVLRHHGFDSVEGALPPFAAGAEPRQPWQVGLDMLRQSLVGSGHHQAVSFSFGAARDMEAWGDSLVDGGGARVLRLVNPIADNLSTMRTSLVPGLLLALSGSVRRGESDVRLFEEGKAFFAWTDGGQHATPVEERWAVAIVQHGRRGNAHFQHRPPAVDLLALKGAVEDALASVRGRALAGSIEIVAGDAPHAAPGSSAEVRLDGERIGWMARLHPDFLAPLELTEAVIAAEIDLTRVLPESSPKPRFQPLSRYPRVVRDVSVIVDRNLAYGAIIAAVSGRARETGSLVESVELMDRYLGQGVPDGKVSLTFTVAYRRQDRTLTQDEVDAAHQEIVDLLAARFGATLRA